MKKSISRETLLVHPNFSKSNNINNNNKVEPTLESLKEHFALNKEDVLLPIMSFQKRINFLLKLLRKSLKTIPLTYFMGRVRRILLPVKTGKLQSQNKY